MSSNMNMNSNSTPRRVIYNNSNSSSNSDDALDYASTISYEDELTDEEIDNEFLLKEEEELQFE